MTIALSIKNKLGFINGSLPKPAGDLLPVWIRNKHVVIAWFLNSVSKPISASLIFTNSTHEIWLDLKDRFQLQNGPQIFQLRRDLATLTQDQLSVTMYYTKLKALWDEYVSYRPGCTCGSCSCGGYRLVEKFVQFEHLMKFLMGLNESFAHIRAQILLMDPPPSIGKAFSLISQEEQQRVIPLFSTPSPAVGLAVNQSRSSSASNSGSRQRNSSCPYCTNCGIRGHTVDKCYRFHGFPSGYRSKGNQHSSTPSMTSSVSSTTSSSPASNSPSTAIVNSISQTSASSSLVSPMTSDAFS